MSSPTLEPGAPLAHRLGIPDAAERVLVLAESSHWDPNWMLTSEQYFRYGVRRTLDLVLDELDRDERRVWSADCVFFLAMYWERRPDRRDRLAAAIDSGRLRLTTSGVTTQDTLLPSTESVLRDFLVGQEWLRSHGMGQEPTLAYFPDSFGHAPTLPTLLASSGFDKAIVTRIDGGYFFGSDWESARRYPRPRSSAAELTEQRSADFVWRDGSGAEVLAHWHPFTYGQGDMIAAVGPLRYMSAPTSVRDRSPRRVAARLRRQADRLGALARTRYLLCPIGMDFVHPIPNLLGLIDEFNEHVYPETGLWVTNAGADDYLDLVGEQRDELPVLELDPNPYWTGFYASRPELKRSHRTLVDRLLLTEADAVADDAQGAVRLTGRVAEPWWIAVTGNHHDFVTGTSPDRVVRVEQEPWLATALDAVDRIRQTAGEGGAPTNTATAPTSDRGAVHNEWVGGLLRVDTGPLVATVDPERGGALTEVRCDGVVVMRGVGADVIAYDDGGGLWRMGGEYGGGRFALCDELSRRAADVAVNVGDDGRVEVVADGVLDGIDVKRRFYFEPGGRSIEVRTECAAGERRTVALRLAAPGAIGGLRMDQPGGVVERPTQRHFTPTFWPVSSWLSTESEQGACGSQLAIALDMSRAVSASPSGQVEIVVARNAPKEFAWKVVPIPAFPARGHDPGRTTATVTMWWPHQADTAELVRFAIDRGPNADRRLLRSTAGRVVQLGHAGGEAGDGLEVLALKPAQRGDGVIVRFIDWDHAPGRRVRLRTSLPLADASLCDVRERDLGSVDLVERDGGFELEFAPQTSVTTVRLVVTGEARP